MNSSVYVLLQGYFQSTPLQLCLMTAQIANGGFEIKQELYLIKKMMILGII